MSRFDSSVSLIDDDIPLRVFTDHKNDANSLKKIKS